MIVIDFETIKQLNIMPQECYKWVSFIIKNKKSAILPPKISLKPGQPGVFYNTMPSIIPIDDNNGFAGVKVVTRYPLRKPALDSEILLYNLNNGENIALLDGDWITTMRTGAVAAHSINLLAVPEFSSIGIIGLGNTARATLKTLVWLYPNKILRIKLKKYKNQHILFSDVFKEYTNLKFIYCDSYEEVVSDSDVIVSAVTTFDEDICGNDCFKKGCLVVPIHTKGFTNCDLFFDKVFADDLGHVKGFKNYAKFKQVAEISDVVNKIRAGRENNSERIIAYNIGISLHDIYFASKIYEMVNKANLINFSLRKPTNKFWLT